MLEQLKRERRVVGLKQSRKAVEAGEAKLAFVADDADERLRNAFIGLCSEHRVAVYHARTMQELGRACGIDIGSGFAVLLR